MVKRLLVFAAVVALIGANAFSPLRVNQVSVHLKPAPVFWIGRFAITNTLLSSWIAMVILVLLAACSRKLAEAPPARSLQNVAEVVIESLYDFMEGFAGPETRAFFPITATFFLFILTSNWLGLVPGFGSVGFWQTVDGKRLFVPLLRGATTDLNTTIALAVASVFCAQLFGMRFLGFSKYLSRFVPFDKIVAFVRTLTRRGEPRFRLLLAGALDLFIGLLGIFEEMTKVLSFSFRLFGNVFGGEVLLAVMAFLMPYVASIPFMALEMMTGFIQALIFAVLSTAFFARAVSEGGPGEASQKEGDATASPSEFVAP